MEKKRTAKRRRPDLKPFRERRGLTQQEVADEIGIDTSTIWRWENWGLPTRGLALKALDRFFDTHKSQKAPKAPIA